MIKLQSSKLFWKDLSISPKELRLNSLRCGQSFRWKQFGDKWVSVLQGKPVILKETPITVLYGYDKELEEEAIVEIRDYLQLDRVSLQECYQRWSNIDANFAKKAIHFEGIRMLRQDPWENVVSFICSSNNNIARISQMIDKLCVRFGEKVGTYDDVELFDFPSLDALTKPDTESVLRELGFGYRAKYVANTAKKIKSDHPEMGEKWLKTLRNVTYSEAKESLMELQGIGPKVADCVCLMSLDHAESIPVDTHVWQIAQRDYGFKKHAKSLTSKLYTEVGDHFRLLFGEYSGWAHSVLFTADLKSFDIETKKRKLEQVNVIEELEVKTEIKVTVKKIKLEEV